ncbi:MAG: purine-binding chemotaxis protein CheW [Phycisphaerales bacterium]|nr:purine-binding chemotaxis protein CheW [Phycisphaerales bacterium]
MTAIQTAPVAGTRTTARGGKYLTFCLASEEYGLEILKVREIIGIMDITSMPQMPCFVKGVINLRGKVIPVIDLRLKFGLEPAEYTEQTCIVVVDCGTLVGVIVDTVQEVLDIQSSQIDPPPPLGATVDTTFILGMGKVKDDVKILLDIDRVLGSDDLTAALEQIDSAEEVTL